MHDTYRVCMPLFLFVASGCNARLDLGEIPTHSRDGATTTSDQFVHPGDCYSPTQNLEIAYRAGAVGCACAEGSAAQCVKHTDGREVALVCSNGSWSAVMDGPCKPVRTDAGEPDACYSPTQNLEIAYRAGAVGCACETGAAGQCVKDSTGRNVALVCANGHWTAAEDGPCMPGPVTPEAGASNSCFSPAQNMDAALNTGAVGCACGEGAIAQCGYSRDHGYVAFMCNEGQWATAFDGPCGKPNPPQFPVSVDGKAYALWVERTCSNPPVTFPPTAPLDEEAYAPIAAQERWAVVFSQDGQSVTLTRTTDDGKLPTKLTADYAGDASAPALAYRIREVAGGMFWVWTNNSPPTGDVVLFGSGLPVTLCERGALK